MSNREIHFDRRRFLAQTITAMAGSGLAMNGIRADEAPGGKSVAAFIAGKDPRLLGHNTKVGEIETPLALLREHRLTPKGLLFVRNNQLLADSLSLQPAPLDGWTIELNGLLDRSRSSSAKELAQLPQVEHELVLQCSGNGRSWFARTVKADGVQWQNGAMGNVRVRGATLASVVAHMKLTVQQAARYVAVEGADSPDQLGAADFEHSVPLQDALEKSLLVLEMNGEPLPRVHGGPVRFVMPGYYATMNVKWVRRLRFEAGESLNHHHVGRYRTPKVPLVPGGRFTSTLENSDPNWNMKIKSVIFSPLDGESLPAGTTPIRGVAWNDGVTRIAAVEISIDGGETWRRAALERAASPYAWHHWNLNATLPAGKHFVQSRAIDARGMTQPFDGSVDWNPAGYAWNGMDRVEVTAG